MDSIKITLETLYDILRNEKKRGELQNLENTFFIDVVSYVREKQALLQEKEKSSNIFAAGEKDKLEYELRSIRRILKEIYELRENKIIDIALNKSKTRSELIDTGAMLREEKEFYENILDRFNHARQQILFPLFKGELPGMADYPAPKKMVVTEKIEENKPATAEKTKIRFIHPTPSFVWKDLKVYGPYDIGEETEMFPEVAELLVRKKRAEKV
ncbi:DNA replication complex GINS family protein [Candidatus Woesearchaeota archaeon]|nr:DNA replication complex GINS family protein [Candidatus Woesearchaeota archaeon]